MEDRRNKRVKDEKKKWSVPSFPVCSVWSFTADLCWGNTSGHFKRTSSGYAFGHVRENKKPFSTQNSVKQLNNAECTKCCSMQPVNLSFTHNGRYSAPCHPFVNELKDDDLQHMKLTIRIKRNIESQIWKYVFPPFWNCAGSHGCTAGSILSTRLKSVQGQEFPYASTLRPHLTCYQKTAGDAFITFINHVSVWYYIPKNTTWVWGQKWNVNGPAFVGWSTHCCFKQWLWSVVIGYQVLSQPLFCQNKTISAPLWVKDKCKQGSIVIK